MVKNKKKSYATEKDFRDITNDVILFVQESGVKNGIVNIFPQHTTACIKIMENEILSLCDINNHLEKLAPSDAHYNHNLIGLRDVPASERINGHSHIRSLYFQTSETIPIIDGILEIGKWQSIMLVELDPVREREVIFTIIGE